MITERQKEILNRVVLLYIKSKEPVGSGSICDEMGLSSATIRNEMSLLSSLGYLEQPHTSAGRIPSQKAYRLYVDELIEKDELSKKEKNFIEEAVFSGATPEGMISAACDVLAELSGLVCISSTPNESMAHISKIELIPIGGFTCLLVLLTESGVIKSAPCRTTENLTQKDTEIFSMRCKEVLGEFPLLDIDKAKIQSLFAALGECSMKFISVSDVLYRLISEACRCELKSGGETNLFYSEDVPFEKAKKILSLIRNQDVLLDLLCFAPQTLKTTIGGETKNEALEFSSIITDGYSFLNRMGGKIGVIGPTRINYAHLIPCVEYTAKVLGSAISSLLRQDGRNLYVQIR